IHRVRHTKTHRRLLERAAVSGWPLGIARRIKAGIRAAPCLSADARVLRSSFRGTRRDPLLGTAMRSLAWSSLSAQS
ncbi:hypothetical protein AAVH_41138, partial [Aphelenchoides avenae]